jgi:CRISPR/Cas system CSM-associated protein Csm3 (group 7 of RAMP superfamily)
MLEIRVTLTFETPLNIGSGAQVSTLADRAFIKERDGWPYIPASTFKGRLRHTVEQVAQGMGQQVCRTHHKMCRNEAAMCPVCAIFGSPWIPGRLRFVDLKLSGPQELIEQRRREKDHPRTDWRYGVALSRRRGVAEDALLYTTELLVPGVPISFSGTLTGPLGKREAAWLVAGLHLLPALGRGKSAGLGWLTAQAEVAIDGQQLDHERLHAALQEVVS